MTERLRALALGDDGYTVRVRPEVVVEVEYNEIQRSPTYPSGMALRFARIARVREDKSPGQTTTLEELRALYERQFATRAGRGEPSGGRPAPLTPFPCVDVHVHLHPRGSPGDRALVTITAGRPGTPSSRRRWPNATRPRRAPVCFFSYVTARHVASAESVVVRAGGRPRRRSRSARCPRRPRPRRHRARGHRRPRTPWLQVHHSVQRTPVDDERRSASTRGRRRRATCSCSTGHHAVSRSLTGFERFARLMARFPRLRVCVAHMARPDDGVLALLPAHPPLRRHHDGHDVPRYAVHGADPGAVSDADLIRHRIGALRLDFPMIPTTTTKNAAGPGSAGSRRRAPQDLHDNALRFLR